MKKAVITFLALGLIAGAASAQKLSIDYRFNTAAEDKANYLNWSLNDRSINDSYDANTGASRAGTTIMLDTVRYDSPSTQRLAIPAGLREILLFPLASRKVATDDLFSVSANGKQLTIRFVHRGNAYEIKTDANGNLNPESSFSMATSIADNIAGRFILKNQYVKSGGSRNNMADLDWTKLSFTPDTASADASKRYTGTLSAAFSNNILTIKGDLNSVNR